MTGSSGHVSKRERRCYAVSSFSTSVRHTRDVKTQCCRITFDSANIPNVRKTTCSSHLIRRLFSHCQIEGWIISLRWSNWGSFPHTFPQKAHVHRPDRAKSICTREWVRRMSTKVNYACPAQRTVLNNQLVSNKTKSLINASWSVCVCLSGFLNCGKGIIMCLNIEP